MYEIYRQDIGDMELVKRNEKRYFTKDKLKAFTFIQNKNEDEGKNVWRVAIRVSDRILFDVDNDNLDNIKKIVNYYSGIFGELKVYKTYTGYHIFTVLKYDNDIDWSYDTCRVLYPILEKELFLKYAQKVSKWYQDKVKEEFEYQLSRKQFIEMIKRSFPTSDLYCGIGDFDILFSLNVILKGYYCLRISKKGDKDKPYEVVL